MINLRSDGEPGSIGVDGLIRGVLKGTDPGAFEGTLTDLSVGVAVVLGQESQTMAVDSWRRCAELRRMNAGVGYF